MAAHPARRCGKASAKCLNVRCCVKKMERNEANKGGKDEKKYNNFAVVLRSLRGGRLGAEPILFFLTRFIF